MALSFRSLTTFRLRSRLGELRPSMVRVAYAWCHDHALAEDLVQDAMVKAMNAARDLRDPQKLKPWLFAILGNCLRDHLRRARPVVSIDDIDELVLEERHQPEAQHERNEVVRRVRAAIARLPVGQRQVVSLVDIEGFGYAEVAEILQVPIGTVMSRLSRARAALRAHLLQTAPGAGLAALRSVK